MLSDNIKAVAFLLEAITVDSLLDRIVNSADLKLKDSLDSLTTLSDRLDDRQQELVENTAALINAGFQLLEYNGKLSRSLEDLTGRLGNRMAPTPAGLEEEGGSMPFMNGSNPATYAAVSQRFLPPSHVSVLAKHNERARQIIIQPAPDVPETLSLRSLSELELITKATLAFNSVDQGVSPAPENLRFVGAKKLAAGGIILDLNSADAASWFKGPAICGAFMQHFSAMSSMKDLDFRVLIEFVPIAFTLDAPAALEQVEHDSGIKGSNLVRAEWAKPPEKRHALPNLLVDYSIALHDRPSSVIRRDG